MLVRKSTVRRTIRYLLVGATILAFLWGASRYSYNDGVGIARRPPRPALFVTDLGLHWSPGQKSVVKIYTSLQGALGTDYMWIYSWDGEGVPYVVVEGNCVADVAAPIVWMSDDTFCVLLLTEDKFGQLDRCFKREGDGSFREIEFTQDEP